MQAQAQVQLLLLPFCSNLSSKRGTNLSFVSAVTFSQRAADVYIKDSLTRLSFLPQLLVNCEGNSLNYGFCELHF